MTVADFAFPPVRHPERSGAESKDQLPLISDLKKGAVFEHREVTGG
jgi:hypothetical protein